MHVNYVGSGPYCYANSFAMMFGNAAPSVAVIEFATSSPFGMQLIGGKLPLFDPYGWDPEQGFDDTLDALGWASDLSGRGTADDALARLKAALVNGPAWVGPLEMGHLHHQPGVRGPIEADHYVVMLEVDGERVLMHDPQGYPYATLPLADFMTAWAAKTLSYGTPYAMRTAFRRVAERSELEMIEASLPAAKRWLAMKAWLPAGARRRPSITRSPARKSRPSSRCFTSSTANRRTRRCRRRPRQPGAEPVRDVLARPFYPRSEKVSRLIGGQSARP